MQVIRVRIEGSRLVWQLCAQGVHVALVGEGRRVAHLDFVVWGAALSVESQDTLQSRRGFLFLQLRELALRLCFGLDLEQLPAAAAGAGLLGTVCEGQARVADEAVREAHQTDGHLDGL